MLYPPLIGEKTMLFKHILVSKARRTWFSHCSVYLWRFGGVGLELDSYYSSCLQFV